MLINLNKWGKGEKSCFYESFSFHLQKYVRTRVDHNNKYLGFKGCFPCEGLCKYLFYMQSYCDLYSMWEINQKETKNPKQRPELCIPSLSKLHPCTNMEFPIWFFSGMLLGHTAFHTGEDHRVKTQTTNNQAEGLLLMRQSPPMKNKEERQEMMGKDTLK